MKVIRRGEQPAQRGTTFTGEVTLERMLEAQQPCGVTVARVTFRDGARTHWHTHPGEQVLVILEGRGIVGNETEQVEVQPGDLVYTPPGEKHWHGAAPGQTMVHLSITTVGPAEWYGPVEQPPVGTAPDQD